MKLSNLDLFQKIDDEKRMATTYGGILSLLSIISVIVLCSLEIKSFLNPPERQHISINSIRPTGSDGRTITMDDQPHVEMYFDITLPSLPCYLVQFDVIDFISQLPLPVNQSKTKFIRLSNDGKEIDRFNYEFLASDVQIHFTPADSEKALHSLTIPGNSLPLVSNHRTNARGTMLHFTTEMNPAAQIVINVDSVWEDENDYGLPNNTFLQIPLFINHGNPFEQQ